MPEKKLARRPRLRSILLLSYVLVLAIPLGGISLLRLYDSMLIRQTEAELIVQGAALSALYRAELRRASGLPPAPTGPEGEGEERFRPAIASLDLARHPVLDPIPPARPASASPTPAALSAGQRLQPILRELQRTSLAGLRVVDEGGTVVASSGREGGLGLSHRPEVAAALAGNRTSVLRRRDIRGTTPPLGSISRGTGLRVVVGFPIRDGERIVGAAVLARTPMSVRQAIYRDRGYFLTVAAVLVASVALLAGLVGAAVARPLAALARQVGRVRRGEKDAAAPLVRPVTREVDEISRAVADMAEALVRRADYIAAFAANVSHEFKTPLTSIHGTVELLTDHLDDMKPDEVRRFLGMLEKDAARLDRLVGRLLELARVDVIRPGDARTAVGPTVARVVRRFRADGLAVEVTPRLDALPPVAVGVDAFESILGNLLENARQHGGDDVRVRIDVRRRGESLHLDVADDGPGISEANRSRVFDRFFTTRRADGGSGLGLAIVKTLTEAHGGAVELRSAPGATTFSVALPRGA
ncbi:MAG: HAMP domain-containing sensor histidine kinase [Acidobacteriota bacterium]